MLVIKLPLFPNLNLILPDNFASNLSTSVAYIVNLHPH
jgi:hypothetical protein